jgi:light-harvesting complex 1 beta chain
MAHGIQTAGAVGPVREPTSSFRLIFLASFTLIFTVALAASLMTLNWRSWFPGAESGKTVVGGVKAAVYTFMSNLS